MYNTYLFRMVHETTVPELRLQKLCRDESMLQYKEVPQRYGGNGYDREGLEYALTQTQDVSLHL